MPDSIGGIPLHPLVVHAVVVLVPLAALGIIVLAVVPRWSRTYGTLLLIATVVAVGAIPVATHTGEQLRATLPETEAIEQHASVGDAMKWFGLLLLVAGVAIWWMGRRRSQERPLGRAPELALRVLCALVAVAALGWVVRTGHSGAETVWQGVGQTSQAQLSTS
jgi:uncharacterized membrane protein